MVDFPGGPVGKNPPASAEDMGSIQEDPPRLGASKPVCCNHWGLVPWSLCSTTREACTPQLEGSLCLAPLEKACVQLKINKFN